MLKLSSSLESPFSIEQLQSDTTDAIEGKSEAKRS